MGVKNFLIFLIYISANLQHLQGSSQSLQGECRRCLLRSGTSSTFFYSQNWNSSTQFLPSSCALMRIFHLRLHFEFVFYVRTLSSFLPLISFRVITYDLHSCLSSALTPFWIFFFGLFCGSEWNSRVFSLKLLLKEAQKKVRPLRLKLETNQSFRRSCRKRPSISKAKFVMVIKSFETCCKHRERVRMEISGLDRDTSTN